MTTNATYPCKLQRTSWSPALDMIHGMELSNYGRCGGEITSRLHFGNNPKMAGG